MKTLSALVLVLFLGTSWAAVPAATPTLKGEVQESIDAGTYTYLRLKMKDGEMWAAVPATTVKKGAQVTVVSPMLMTNFQSKTLNRSFDKIVFGTLAGSGAAPQAAPSMPPHGTSPTAAPVAVGKVAKATGPNAYTVGEVGAQRAKLAGKTVTVRGQVVKFMANVMGKNWVHLQDGSGSASDGTNDLLVTTKDVARKGDVVVARGVARIDADFGYGYTYKFMLEDATLKK